MAHVICLIYSVFNLILLYVSVTEVSCVLNPRMSLTQAESSGSPYSSQKQNIIMISRPLYDWNFQSVLFLHDVVFNKSVNMAIV